jgi:hypothetical protein
MGAFEVEHCACEAGRWLFGGWHETLAYAFGFFVMLPVLGWHPTGLEPRHIRSSPQHSLLTSRSGTNRHALPGTVEAPQ